MPTECACVTVPATSANLGPGFDSLGLALSLHNRFEIHLAEPGLIVEVQEDEVKHLPADERNVVVQAADAVFNRVGYRPEGLKVITTKHIPPGGGLGSSATALVGGVAAANALLGNPLSADALMEIAVTLEGHPDNVAAAMLGGLTISTVHAGALYARRVNISPMKVVIVLPDQQISTAQQREALPSMVPLKDAAGSIGRAALVVQALSAGDFDLLAGVMIDVLHEPVRSRSITGWHDAARAAKDAGAAAVAISGAGPALIAFAPDKHAQIGRAASDVFAHTTGKPARSWILSVDQEGTRVATR